VLSQSVAPCHIAAALAKSGKLRVSKVSEGVRRCLEKIG
jgi:hypothetical protein